MALVDSNRNNPDMGDIGATILLVEDDAPLLVFFSTVLRREGYSVLPASNGVEALDIAESRPNHPIHILFSDVEMPYMEGIQLAESLLREMRPDILVLLTSGLPQQEVSNRCGPEFHADFLAKPFPSPILPVGSSCSWRASSANLGDHAGKS